MLSLKAIICVCILMALLFLLFVVIAFNTGPSRGNLDIAETSIKMEFAFAWMLRASGCLVAIIAAIHLIRFAGQRDFMEQLVPGAIAMLGGLLLLGQHWVLITAFAVLIVAFMFQQLIIRVIPPPPASSKPVARNSPATGDHGQPQPVQPG
jgi:hypothetical protein